MHFFMQISNKNLSIVVCVVIEWGNDEYLTVIRIFYSNFSKYTHSMLNS